MCLQSKTNLWNLTMPVLFLFTPWHLFPSYVRYKLVTDRQTISEILFGYPCPSLPAVCCLLALGEVISFLLPNFVSGLKFEMRNYNWAICNLYVRTDEHMYGHPPRGNTAVRTYGQYRKYGVLSYFRLQTTSALLPPYGSRTPYVRANSSSAKSPKRVSCHFLKRNGRRGGEAGKNCLRVPYCCLTSGSE